MEVALPFRTYPTTITVFWAVSDYFQLEIQLLLTWFFFNNPGM